MSSHNTIKPFVLGFRLSQQLSSLCLGCNSMTQSKPGAKGLMVLYGDIRSIMDITKGLMILYGDIRSILDTTKLLKALVSGQWHLDRDVDSRCIMINLPRSSSFSQRLLQKIGKIMAPQQWQQALKVQNGRATGHFSATIHVAIISQGPQYPGCWHTLVRGSTTTRHQSVLKSFLSRNKASSWLETYIFINIS